jgi:hypothetical protein
MLTEEQKLKMYLSEVSQNSLPVVKHCTQMLCLYNFIQPHITLICVSPRVPRGFKYHKNCGNRR